jgi:3-hydroxyisobutyrate dehydrogenase
MAKKKSVSVGVIGLGSMGMGVARTLVQKGFKVHAFDVRREALRALSRAGGVPAQSPAEVGANAGIVIVLVVNAEQTDLALFGRDGAVPAWHAAPW